MERKDFVIPRSSYSLNASLTYMEEIELKGYLLYFHGGGLLFGTKDDLPEKMIDYYCRNGFGILSFDYGLSPYTKLPGILTDIKDEVSWFLDNQDFLPKAGLPWFLWGRSAGAYLCLISTLLKYIPYPNGILSYYGYGFLEPDWYHLPNPYYNGLPACSFSDFNVFMQEGPCTSAPLQERYSFYVHARQTGNWISLFYNGKTKNFLKKYTFLLHEVPADYPPVFLTHALQDPDVPFAESKALYQKLPSSVFYPVSSSEHDFDRDADSYTTNHILELSFSFLEEHLTK